MESVSRSKPRYPSRALLGKPAIAQAIQEDIAARPPPHTTSSVDDHDRLLTKLFRDVWLRHGLAVSRVLHSPWITPAVWTCLQDRALARRCHTSTNNVEKQACLQGFVLAWRDPIYRWSRMRRFAIARGPAGPCRDVFAEANST